MKNTSHTAFLDNLKTVGASLVATLSFSLFAVGCGAPTNVAADYLKTKTSSSDSKAATVDPATPAANTGTVETTQPTAQTPPVEQTAQTPPTTTPPAASGDAVKGAALIKADCAACHPKLFKVTLDATAVARLDTAKGNGNHDELQADFTGANRLDLEAALKAVK